MTKTSRKHKVAAGLIAVIGLGVGVYVGTHTAPDINPCVVGKVTYCAINSDVTQATIKQTICVSGWTSTVRPPTAYTNALKLSQMASEGFLGSPSAYEEDHRLPLELGGAPSDPKNLSPEAHPGSSIKDKAENDARRAVCSGADLRSTQKAFIQKWLDVYPLYRYTD